MCTWHRMIMWENANCDTTRAKTRQRLGPPSHGAMTSLHTHLFHCIRRLRLYLPPLQETILHYHARWHDTKQATQERHQTRQQHKHDMGQYQNMVAMHVLDQSVKQGHAMTAMMMMMMMRMSTTTRTRTTVIITEATTSRKRSTRATAAARAARATSI